MNLTGNKYKMYVEELEMKRKEASYKIGFCLLKCQLTYLEQQRHLLHPEEFNYYNTLRFDKRKASYLVGRLSSKRAISILQPQLDPKTIAITTGVFGFPVVKHISSDHLQVSISHSDEYGIAIAFPEEHPIGVDIEMVQPDKLSAMKVFIDSKVEKQLIGQHDISEILGYTILWTVKESLSKILKTGFTLSSEILAIQELDTYKGVYLSTFRHFKQYRAVTFCEGTFVCSLVVPRSTTFDWKALKHLFSDL